MISFFFSIFVQSIKYLEPHQDWEIPIHENLFTGRMWGSNNFRIPAIAYMKDNSILALTDFRYNHAGDLPAKIGVGGRKRFSNGTYTSGFIITGTPVRNVGDGDVAVVVDRKTGCVFAVWSGDKGFQGGTGSISTAANPAHVYFSRSWDNGESWEERHDITHFIYSNLCTKCDYTRKNHFDRLFVTSGNGCQMRDGTLVFAVLVHEDVNNKNYNYVLYTEDMGDTWDLAKGRSQDGADEAKLIELNNGDLMISIRRTYSRSQEWSKDRGDTWYRNQNMQNITHYRTNGDLRRMTSVIDGFDKNRILHTLIFNGGGRRNVSLMISYDEGETWPYRKSIEFAGSAYSSVDSTKEGEIFVFYEKDGPTTYDMNMAKVSLEWLTEGTDHYEKPKLLKWCYLTDPKNEGGVSKCPDSTYKYGFKVFDQYIDSYMLYPEEVQYTFVDKFRDFNVDLSIEGLNTGNYNRLSSNSNDRNMINFIGKSSPDHKSRSITINNFDVSLPASEVSNINLILTNGDLTFKKCEQIDIFVSSNSNKIGIKGWDDKSKSNLYTIPSTKNVIFEVSGNINVHRQSEYSSSKSSSKLLEDSLSKIKFIGANKKNPTTIKLIGDWSKEEGNKICFEQDSTNQFSVEIKKGSENNFDLSATGDKKPNIIVIQDPTSPPTSAPTSAPTSVPTSLPTSEPTSEPSLVPTETVSPSETNDNNNANKSKESKGVSYLVAVLIGMAGLIVGLLIGLIILFVTKRKSTPAAESQSGLVFTPILD